MTTLNHTIRRSRRKHMIYIGEPLRDALLNRKTSLSNAVNNIAERYSAILERASIGPMMDYHAELYCNVLREMPKPLTSQQIAAFAGFVQDWLALHPEFPQEPGKTAVMILSNSPFVDLVALIDKLERQL